MNPEHKSCQDTLPRQGPSQGFCVRKSCQEILPTKNAHRSCQKLSTDLAQRSAKNPKISCQKVLQRTPPKRSCALLMWGALPTRLRYPAHESCREILCRDPAKIRHKYPLDRSRAGLPRFHVDTTCRGCSLPILKRELVGVLSDPSTDPAKILPPRSCPGNSTESRTFVQRNLAQNLFPQEFFSRSFRRLLQDLLACVCCGSYYLRVFLPLFDHCSGSLAGMILGNPCWLVLRGKQKENSEIHFGGSTIQRKTHN